jgi:hypothetical protein
MMLNYLTVMIPDLATLGRVCLAERSWRRRRSRARVITPQRQARAG